MNKLLLSFTLGLALGLLLRRVTANRTEDTAVAARYAAVKAREPNGPTDMGLPLGGLL